MPNPEIGVPPLPEFGIRGVYPYTHTLPKLSPLLSTSKPSHVTLSQVSHISLTTWYSWAHVDFSKDRKMSRRR